MRPQRDWKRRSVLWWWNSKWQMVSWKRPRQAARRLNIGTKRTPKDKEDQGSFGTPEGGGRETSDGTRGKTAGTDVLTYAPVLLSKVFTKA